MNRIYDGVLVIDFSNNLAGPVCAAMLADHGAEVIKVERPIDGDDSRSSVPLFDNGAIQNIWYNRGKKSIEAALDDADVKLALHSLIKEADIVIESFKPGQMKKFGLDYDAVSEINPNLVYLSISACGQTGGYSKEPGFDIIAQGMSGLMDLCGDPQGLPVKAGVPIGDYVASFNAFGAISAAMYHRQRTGEGQYIDVSLMDSLLYCNTYLDNAATLGNHLRRNGNHHATAAPYGVYMGNNEECIIIAAPAPAAWARLCNAMGKTEMINHPDFNSGVQRVKNLHELVKIIEEWLGTFDHIEEVVSILKTHNVPCSKIRSTYEAAQDPVLWERGSLIEIPTPTSFKTRIYKGRAHPTRYSATPAIIEAAPDLGEHNYEIYGRIGWNREKVDEKLSFWKSKKQNG